jgi:hypothetical protein
MPSLTLALRSPDSAIVVDHFHARGIAKMQQGPGNADLDLVTAHDDGVSTRRRLAILAHAKLADGIDRHMEDVLPIIALMRSIVDPAYR